MFAVVNLMGLILQVLEINIEKFGSCPMKQMDLNESNCSLAIDKILLGDPPYISGSNIIEEDQWPALAALCKVSLARIAVEQIIKSLKL